MMSKKYVHTMEYMQNRTIEGKPVRRNRYDYPYSYSRFCVYKSEDWKYSDDSMYSDRLRGWYGDRYGELTAKYLNHGACWSDYEPEEIEKFLSELLEKPIAFTGLEQECNASNGYPYWIIYYREKGETSDE